MRTLWPLLAAALLSTDACAGGWKPQRPVEIVSPGPVGGSLDGTTRAIDKLLHQIKALPVKSSVVNRSGDERAHAYEYIGQHAGDPHRISLASPLLLANHITGTLSTTYIDVTPIACLVSEYYVYAVRSDSVLKTGADLVQALKVRPDSHAIAVGTLLTRIATGLVMHSANLDPTRARVAVVPGATRRARGTLGGQFEVTVASVAQMLPFVENGRMRVIAVTSPKRLGGVLASAPTWTEQGFDDATVDTWRCVIAPRALTAPQVAYWEDALRRVSEHPDFKRLGERNHWDIHFKGASKTGRFMAAEYERMKRVTFALGFWK